MAVRAPKRTFRPFSSSNCPIRFGHDVAEYRPMASYPRLAAFLDQYLNDDFRTEYVTHKAAARAFKEGCSPELVAATRDELTEFLAWAETVPTFEWQQVFTSLGGRWKPRSLGPLRGVLSALDGGHRGLHPGEKPIRPRWRY
jgi:hypothetical protein